MEKLAGPDRGEEVGSFPKRSLIRAKDRGDYLGLSKRLQAATGPLLGEFTGEAGGEAGGQTDRLPFDA